MGERAISIRLDDEAERALQELTAAAGSRSAAVRAALVEVAARRRHGSLAAEAEELARDPEDRAEMAEVAALMEALRAAR